MTYDATQTLKDQLLHQFKYSENINKLLDVIGDMFQDTLDVAAYLESMVDLDDYEGVHLDQWGELLGVDRPPAQETKIFMTVDESDTSDLDNDHGFEDTTDPTVTTGGYLEGEDGLEALDGSMMSDEDYRYLIRQKSASLRTSPTNTKLFEYLLAFGSRCVIDDDTTFKITYDPVRYYDLDTWNKNYVITRGFKPSGISTEFVEKYREEDPI